MKPPLAVPVALALGLSLSACAGTLHGQVGPVFPFNGEEQKRGTAVDLYGAFSDSPVAPSIGLRTRFTPEVRQAALSLDLIGLSRVALVSPWLRGGVHVLQYETGDAGAAWSAGSPYAEGGLLVALDTELVSGVDKPSLGLFLSLGASVEYTVRLDERPNQPYWGAMLGVGMFYEVR